ncbi:MAG: hypothetical protein ACLFUO_03660 [Candidatus Woesearchaeota archaeon]
MQYETKSALIARKKIDEDKYNCIVNLFDINNPQESKEAPKTPLEFEDIDHVEIDCRKINFYLLGNDIVLNDLSSIEIEQDENVLRINCSE